MVTSPIGLCRSCRLAMPAHAAATAGFSTQEGEIPLETDCLLEGDGFELPVRGRGQSVCRPFCRTRLLKVAAGDAESQETTRAFSGSPGPAPPCTRGCGWRVGWNGPARSSRRLSPLSLLLLPISLRFGRRASIICCEAFRRLHPQPSTERAAAPVQATSKAGSLRRLPILPKQPGASKGATTSFTAPAY